MLELPIAEHLDAADAEETGDGGVDVRAGAVEGFLLFELRHDGVAMDADAGFFLRALRDVRQDDDAARGRLADLSVPVDFAGDGEIFFVVRDVVEVLVGLVARVAAEDHVAAVRLLPDGQRMPEAVLVDGLEDERILVRLRLSEEVPRLRRRLQLVAREDCLETCGDEFFYTVICCGRLSEKEMADAWK